jgi:hypothetical protein
MDPSPSPRDALIGLAQLLGGKFEARLIVLNASSLLPEPDAQTTNSQGEVPFDLRIRRANLAILEASHESGLAVLDADRIAAESPVRPKTTGPFLYATDILDSLHSTLWRILSEMGLADYEAMELRAPFVRQVAKMHLDRWLKSAGDSIDVGDVICEIRVKEVRSFSRPTSALVLASINQAPSTLRRFIGLESTYHRKLDASLSVIAAERGAVRRIAQPPGASLKPGTVLAIITPDLATPLADAGMPFQVVIETADADLERML